MEIKTLDDVRKKPYNLPTGFEWFNIDMHDPKVAAKLYKHLTKNYVEDDDNMFRFDYSMEFLKWALTAPGQYPDWVVGVRTIKKKKIVGCITGIPLHMLVITTVLKYVYVFKRLMGKRCEWRRLTSCAFIKSSEVRGLPRC